MMRFAPLSPHLMFSPSFHAHYLFRDSWSTSFTFGTAVKPSVGLTILDCGWPGLEATLFQFTSDSELIFFFFGLDWVFEPLESFSAGQFGSQ